MNETKPRIIKKYQNRRLYDTERSCYITQDQIKRYVSKGISFRVITAKTGDDITRAVLLHIILDEEIMGVPLFTEEALRSIILFSGSGMRGSMSSFLEHMLPALQQNSALGGVDASSRTNEHIRDHVAALQGLLLGNTFQEYINRNMEVFGKANQSIAQNAVKMMKITPPDFNADHNANKKDD